MAKSGGVSGSITAIRGDVAPVSPADDNPLDLLCISAARMPDVGTIEKMSAAIMIAAAAPCRF